MKRAIQIIILFNLVRLIILPFMGMMPQDAYYYFYSEHLSLSYFDHPPMVAYTQYFFSLIFGKSVFSVKFTDFILTAGTQIVFFLLASKILRSSRKYLAWILLSTTLMISSLSMVTTPDVPLMLFWSLSVLMLYRAIFEKNIWSWIWAGIFMGLAFDSKYTAIVLPAGLFLFLIFSSRYRSYLLKPWPYLSVLIMAIVMLPVIIWNINNDFASFAFQSSQRAETITELTPENFVGLIGTQLFLLLPIVFIGLWWVMFRYFGRIFKKPNQVNPELWFLISFFAPLFLGFYLLSFFLWVKLNWLMPAYITGTILLSRFINPRWLKWHLGFSIAFHLLVIIELFFYPIAIKSDDTWYGWKELAKKTEQIHNKHPESFIFSADGYKTTAQLLFFTTEKIYGKNILGVSALHYDYIGDDLTKLIGKNAIFIDSEKQFHDNEKSGDIPKILCNHFNMVVELDPIIIKKGNRTVRKFLVYHCKNYKGADNTKSNLIN